MSLLEEEEFEIDKFMEFVVALVVVVDDDDFVVGMKNRSAGISDELISNEVRALIRILYILGMSIIPNTAKTIPPRHAEASDL